MAYSKRATTDYPVQDLIAERFSPMGFEDRPVPADDLRSLFEAARWAASCYNEQPWRFIVAVKQNPEEYQKVLSCLVEANQRWAQAAPVLALGVVSTTFHKGGKPNRFAGHDLGQASASLSLEAVARGLAVHQMGGILPSKAVQTFGVPDGFEVITGLAIGYPAQVDAPEDLAKRDRAPRTRKPIKDFVFGAQWGGPHPLDGKGQT